MVGVRVEREAGDDDVGAREKGDVVDESVAAVAEDEEEEKEEVEGRRRWRRR